MGSRVALVPVCAAVAVLAACGGGSGSDRTSKESAVPTLAPPPPLSDDDPDTKDFVVDVGGRKIFMVCRGSGSPTVVYVHGMNGGIRSGTELVEMVGRRQRVCAYDRPNGLGVSDAVDGPVTGNGSVAELHALLTNAKVPGPYVLLGASWGGLISDMYASTYPDDTAGMVLLDSPLPDALVEDRFFPKRFRARPGGWKDNPEKMDELTTFHQAQRLQGGEPDVPVTYIGTKRLELPPSVPRKAITAVERGLQHDFVSRFSAGRLVLVDSPHYMEPEIPGRIAQEVRRVVAASTRRDGG